jgi:predicted dehydrogenase
MSAALRFGIAGLMRGSHFLPALNGWEETVVSAVVEPDAARVEKLGSDLGSARVCLSLEEMLDSGVNAVIVATPMYQHAPQSAAALKRDIHVFSEVSAATSLEQCRELVAAARDSEATYMMGENCCYMKPFALVKRMVEAGLFGEVYYAEGEYVHEVRPFPGSDRWREKWLFGRRGATYITHPLGTVLHWLDDRVVSVNCVGSGAHVEPEWDNDDASVMLCRTSRGALVKIRHDEMSPRPSSHNYAGLQGTKGAYEAVRHPGDTHRVCLAEPGEDPKKRKWRSLWEFEQQYLPDWWRGASEEGDIHGGSDGLTLRAFVDALLSGDPSPIDVYRALDFTVPGLMSEVSARQGGVPVAVPDFRFH